VGNTALMEEIRNAYILSSGKHDRKDYVADL
jgi:hypothetical protein